MRQDRIVRWCAVLGLLAVLVSSALLTAASLLTPGYSSLEQSLSDLTAVRMPYDPVARAAVMAFGVLVLPLSYAAYRVAGGGGWGRLEAALFIAIGVLFTVSGAFPDDLKTEVALGLTADEVHDSTANAGAVALGLAVVASVRFTWARPSWGLFPWFSIAVVVTAVVFWVPFFFLLVPTLTGLFERAIVGPLVLWVGVLAVQVLRLPV